MGVGRTALALGGAGVHNGSRLIVRLSSALLRVAVPALAAVWAVLSAPAMQARQAPAAPAAPAATTTATSTTDRARFAAFVQDLKAEAVTRGITEAVAARALDGLEPLPVVVARDRDQAEAVLSIDTYVRRRLTAATVRKAQRMFTQHRVMLDTIGKTYGVQPRYLVAVWGLESNFGAFTGVRPTVQALATLAFDGRRGELFKNELFDALRIVERGHANLDALRGSWAGAMGQPQFLPSSYLAYARDGDGDGRVDIWANDADVAASIANYLARHGWQRGLRWGQPVTVPGNFDRQRVRDLVRPKSCVRPLEKHSRWISIAEWRRLGLTSATPFPADSVLATLVEPDGPGQGAYLTTGNYRALLGYNCSNFYALSVALLADAISTQYAAQ